MPELNKPTHWTDWQLCQHLVSVYEVTVELPRFYPEYRAQALRAHLADAGPDTWLSVHLSLAEGRLTIYEAAYPNRRALQALLDEWEADPSTPCHNGKPMACGHCLSANDTVLPCPKCQQPHCQGCLEAHQC